MAPEFTPDQTIFSGYLFWVIAVLYLPIIVIVYYVAESRQENGQLWAILSAVMPFVIPIVYFLWILISSIRNRQTGRGDITAFENPATEYSRQRLRGGSEFIGKQYDEIELLLMENELNEAEELIRSTLTEAEDGQDGSTISDMIAYLERLKKLRK